MGCDIHLYVERKVGEIWEACDKWQLDNLENTTVDYPDRFYTGRNYELFAILAGVRNRYDVYPIVEPRGIPGDVSSNIAQEYESWGFDAHTPSWLTLAEFFAYDWTQTVKLSGLLQPLSFHKWNLFDRKNGEFPEEYAQGSSAKQVSEAEMESAIKEVLGERHPYDKQAWDDISRRLWNTCVYCEWEMPYYKTSRAFWSDTIPRLLRLGKPDDVRIVFWFDN